MPNKSAESLGYRFLGGQWWVTSGEGEFAPLSVVDSDLNDSLKIVVDFQVDSQTGKVSRTVRANGEVRELDINDPLNYSVPLAITFVDRIQAYVDGGGPQPSKSTVTPGASGSTQSGVLDEEHQQLVDDFLKGPMAAVGVIWGRMGLGPWPPMNEGPYLDSPPEIDTARIQWAIQQFGDVVGLEEEEDTLLDLEIQTDPKTGAAFFRNSAGGFSQLQELSLDDLMIQALSRADLNNPNDTSLQRALALQDFQNQPTDLQLFDRVLELAHSPADQLTLMMIRQGFLPLQKGLFGDRVGPLFAPLKDLVTKLFDPQQDTTGLALDDLSLIHI